MSASRTNAGKQTGLFIVELGNWTLRQTADGRYKVAARDPVNGKANYAFGIREGKLDTHMGLDATKLKDERPELHKAVEGYFRSLTEQPLPMEEEADPYGDLAISRRRKLTPEQNWKRGLLQMRRLEFEHAAAKKESIWESAVRMLWAGVFKTRIPDDKAAEALLWITQRQGGVDLKMLLQVEQDYYSGRYAPNSSRALEEKLGMLAGANEFDNEEETEDGPRVWNDNSGTADGVGPRESSQQDGDGEQAEVRRSGGSPAATGDGVYGSESAVEDPFAAFQ